jgi:serine phosphatase RsbU (regulator of sigma subunit)
MSEATGPPRPPTEAPPRHYDHPEQLLTVLARLPIQVLKAQSERQLREAVAPAIAELLGPIRRFELFITESPAGTLVPTGEPREGLSLLGAAMAAGEPALARAQIIPGITGRGDILCAPVNDRGGSLGVILAEAVPGAEHFDGGDLEALTGVAAQITLALQRLRLEARGAAARRLERDMVLAREVQRRFLPRGAPSRKLRVQAHYRPAYDVGGDFYDLVPSGGSGGGGIANSGGANSDRVMAVIGDVAGKGVAAALLMSRVSSDLRRLATDQASPARLLEELNAAMGGENAETFATVACIAIDTSGGPSLVANAGHVAPVVRRASGTVSAFGRASGPPVGVVSGQRYGDETIILDAGDTIFLMTDGLAEALDRPGDRLGTRLLISLIADAPPDPAQACQRILAAVERERVLRHVDDVTLVAIQLLIE